MRGVCRVVFAAVVLAASAVGTRAEDPPSADAKHVNQITPEAKAAIEKFRSLVYRLEDHGLSSMSAAIVALGFDRPVRATFEFTRTDGFWPIDAEALEKEQRRHKLVGNTVGFPLRLAFDAFGVLPDKRLDAAIESVGDERVLTITAYRDGNPSAEVRCLFEEHGLLRRQEWRDIADRGRGALVSTYSWIARGDRWLIAKLDMVHPEPNVPRKTYEFRYADVEGVHLPVSYDIEFTPKDGASRKLSFHVADLVVNGKAVALPTPWKHANDVSPEAQVAIERYRRLTYRPAEHGLASISGDVIGAVPGRWRFEFAPPRRVKAGPAEGSEVTEAQRRTFRQLTDSLLSAAYEGVPLTEGDEYDARFEERAGVRVLVVRNFRDGVAGRSSEFMLDADGLVATAVHDATEGLRPTISFLWNQVGGSSRLVRIDLDVGDAGTSARVGATLEYSTVADIALFTRAKVTLSVTRDGKTASRDFEVRLDGLVVNGQQVELPRRSARNNVVTPAAKAVIDAYAKLLDRATDRGLTTASGVIAPFDLRLTATASSVTVSVPSKDATATSAAIARGIEPVLTLAILGVPLSFSPKFDAELVERDGANVLVATEYRNGEASARTTTTFDASGLPVAMNASGLAPGAPASEYRFEWSKSGSRWRLATLELWDAKQDVHVTTRFTYAEVAGTFVPSAFRQTYTGGDVDGMSVEFVVHDLVVNGKPVEATPSPADKK